MATNKNKSLALVSAAPAHTEDKLAATLTISNTDIVTMLAVKNRKHLADKRSKLLKEYITLIGEEAAKMEKKFLAVLKKAVNPQIEAAFKTIMSALNPKVELTVEVSIDGYGYRGRGEGKSRFWYLIADRYSNYSYRNDDDNEDVKVVITALSYKASCVDEDEEEGLKIPHSWNDAALEIPVKKTTLILPRNKRLIEVCEQMNQIDKITSSESKLRDAVVAQVTERAIADSPMLSKMVMDIPMLAIGE